MLRRHQQLDFPGSRHFITTVTEVRGKWFFEASTCLCLLRCFEECRAKNELTCICYALMPDHLHAVLMQGENSGTVSQFMHDFKVKSAYKCRPHGYSGHNLWRRRYDDVFLPGPDAVRNRISYVNNNPVEAGIVEDFSKYAWSSVASYLYYTPSIVQLTPYG